MVKQQGYKRLNDFSRLTMSNGVHANHRLTHKSQQNTQSDPNAKGYFYGKFTTSPDRRKVKYDKTNPFREACK